MKGFVSALLSSWLLGGHAQNIVPDCGRAFQPCCTGAESCVEGFSCIDRGAAGIICEPCGDPFSQPCPMAPYCSSSQLVPTARNRDQAVQCAPCGSEWEPCCPELNNLCQGDLDCYSEQDRCVVSEYIWWQEEFLPVYDSGDGGFSISTQMNDLGFVLCGGLNESPCLLKLNATALPVWECDEPLAIIVPDFLCGEVPDGDSGESADDGSCGALQRMPCDGRGCDAGLSAVNFEGEIGLLCANASEFVFDPDGQSF